MQHARLRPHGTLAVVTLALGCLLLCACQKAKSLSSEPPGAAVATQSASGVGGAQFATSARAQSAPTPDGVRRIIRAAELSVETEAPDTAASTILLLADAKAGFVVSSETNRSTDADGAENVTTTIVLRVPVAAFDETLVTVRALGTRVSGEKVTGQDVTEEYVNLEARLRAQRAVEEQYLSVLREAKAIPDILAVQQKLGEVRTEIERAEGRRRYLDSQTSLSTLTVHVSRHLAAVEASGPGFARSVREAGHDAASVGVAIVNGAIRLVGVLLPVGLLIVLPGMLLARAWRRRQAKA